jgi:hypothetical protein
VARPGQCGLLPGLRRRGRARCIRIRVRSPAETCRRSVAGRTSTQQCRRTSWRRRGRRRARSRQEAVMEQGVVSLQRSAKAAYDPSFRRQGLFESQPSGQQQHRAETGQDTEDAAPAHDPAELAAEDGGDHRCQPGYQEQSREEDHQRAAGIEIAGDGPGDHYSSRTCQALDQPKQREDRSRGRESASNGGQDVGQQPDDQRTFAARAGSAACMGETLGRSATRRLNSCQVCARAHWHASRPGLEARRPAPAERSHRPNRAASCRPIQSN